ncbi:hepatoma-derived growth factor-related protein 2-like isoform X6 [Palaemon carinicauda]|uniref:hepatoma-derived growth factor-related protein 2-like isoform X6 n=1 Tax=Palaemon carinicauda TaxID=392227 RepID=UPI0035B67E30
MPSVCAVFGCHNNSKKTTHLGVRYFSFPKDEETKKKWMHACKRADNVNWKRALICSVHFKADDYADSMKYRLLGIEKPKNQRALKEEAVPSLLLPIGSRKKINREEEALRATPPQPRITGSRKKINREEEALRATPPQPRITGSRKKINREEEALRATPPQPRITGSRKKTNREEKALRATSPQPRITGADRDNQRPGPSDDPSQSSTSRDESSRASTERGKKGPVTKTKLGQRKRKEAANVNTTGDEVNTQEQKKEDLRSSSRTNKGGGSRSRTSKRKRTPAKANDDLQEGGVEEKEDVEKEVNVKKLKVEEERPVEKEEEIEAKEEEIEEMSDSSDMIPFQEIKIEEEDPLDAPYPLDDEVNISEAPDVALTSGILFKREEPLPWMDKTDKDKSSIAVAEEDSSKKENKPGQSKTPKTGSKSKKADSKEKNSEDLEETHKNLRKSKVVGKQEKSPSDKQQKSPSNKQQKSPSNKQQEPPAAAEVTRKRCRKILREDSQSELSELSLQLTKDIYDVFGMHVAKTLRDINDIKVFNRVKIKINEILLDALAGYYSNPGFERETSEGKPILSQDHEISNNTDSSNQDLEKRTDMKKSSSANNDTHKTTLPLSDTDQTQAVSVDHSSSVSQHSRMPIQIINPPILLPVNSSNLKPSQSKTENTCQDSRTLQTTPFVHQPGTILVNFTFPLMAQSSVVDNSRTLPTTQSIQQPGTIPGNSSFPTVTQSSDLNDSRTLEAKSIYQPGTILVNSSCPDTTRASVLDPDDNSSHHSTITETFHGTDILGGDPNITTTGPVDSSSSRSQHCVLTKTEARGIDAAQTSTIHPHGSISQHSGSPVTGHDKTHHPQVPGKKIKKETDLNPLQS